jgi:hypothetical protein
MEAAAGTVQDQDKGPWAGVAQVYMVRKCAALLETLRIRGKLMERHFVLRHSRADNKWHHNELEKVCSCGESARTREIEIERERDTCSGSVQGRHAVASSYCSFGVCRI